MPDISRLGGKRDHPPKSEDGSECESSFSSSESESESEPEPQVDMKDIPEACLACGKEKVTHLTVPCRHPCLCQGCAMKLATGGKCKVIPSRVPPPLFPSSQFPLLTLFSFLHRFVRGCL